jgi:hypothetical protein
VRHQEAEKLIGDRNGFGQNTENHNFIKREVLSSFKFLGNTSGLYFQ